MRYYSTKNPDETVSFEQAIMHGIAPDCGLYMPSKIPPFQENQLEEMRRKTFQEIAFEVISPFVENEIPSEKLMEVIDDAYSFDTPLVELSNHLAILELFHGPTMAFKDFGARFMARVMKYFNQKYSSELIILVATSGDTGSAVANGFFKQEGIRVILLYPSGMVSEIQEKQLTTMGENVIALEVRGTFDDCQQMVKTAFLDKDLRQIIRLSSANSINIARLIPQMVYYVYAYTRLNKPNQKIIFSVPSGNLGNLTAGIFAHEMGIPVQHFVAALNQNNVFETYLRTGQLVPRKAIPTISNAMDVGNPSNLARIRAFYKEDLNQIRSKIYAYSFNDDQTSQAIKEIYDLYGYVMDPHGAVGYLGWKEDYSLHAKDNDLAIVLGTAHPAKFKRSVENILDLEIEMPDLLKQCLAAEKKSIRISNSYKVFKEFLADCFATS